MTTLTLRQHSIRQSKLRLLSLPSINWKLAYLAMVGLMLVMLVFYIYSINTLTGGSYLIKDYNKQISLLERDNGILESNFAVSGLMGNVQQKAQALSFEKTTKVTYIELTGGKLTMAQ